MDKKIKAVQLKKRIAVENINALERFIGQFSGDDANQIPEALEDLERHKEGFFAAVAKLEELDDSNEAIEACIMERISVEERCRKLKSFLRENQRRENGSLNETTGLASSTLAFGRPNAPHLRLPKIELPTFDGDQTKWLSFRDRFIAMIDASPELPSIAKLEYLLSSLKGDAALPFEHTPLTADNYSVTWTALLKRYDNPRLLVREYYRKLHYLPGVQSESVEKLTNLVDEFSRYVNGFVKLNEPVDSWDTPLSNMLLMKLDRATLLAWEKHSVHFTKDKYKDVLEFVHDRIQILKSTNNFASETSDCSRKVAGTFRPSAPRRSIANAASARSSPPSVSSYKCPLQCGESHLLRNCPMFCGKDVQQRREIVASKHLCWNCLSDSHQVKACKSDYACRTCGQRHHTLLHIPVPNATVALATQTNNRMVFLETALLLIVDGYGNRHEARALLDSGSMSNFISDELARKLIGTSRKRVNVSVSGIGNALQRVSGSLIAAVESTNRSHVSQLELLIVDTPFWHIPPAPVDASAERIPDVPLADPSFYEPGKIDIIIGGDTYWELHSGRKRSLGKGKPWLVETSFGWVIAGQSSKKCALGSSLCHMSTSESPPLESILERFWELESIADGPALSSEEETCEKHFVGTTTRDASGRYVVRLPQSSNPGIVLGASKAIADRRLLAVERRLRCNPTMMEEYIKFMKEYERLGHMKLLTEPVDDACDHYYLPHHAVVKETSTTTKVRVVFDASCKTSSGYSLNDKLLVGPVVQDDLFTIITRFRSHAVALSADVEKMYRQILHDDRDQRYLRIRYRENPKEPIQTYQLQTVTYGTASAPFLATRTLQQIAYDHQSQYPRAVNAVLHDFYVDDLLTGTDDVMDAIEIRKQISGMLNSAGFSLKKWASNVPEALEGVASEDLAMLPIHEWQDQQYVSTLGLVWEPAVDMLRFRIDLPPTAAVLTKRLTLSYIAKVFDPLGLLSPTIIVAKLFMQQLWALKSNGKAWDWDSELPSHLQGEWRAFHSKLHLLREVRIPRFAALRGATSKQLHIFADASQLAYGACCYLRTEGPSGVSVQLLAAKSKVVALANTNSMARLELCAAKLATQLFQKVSRSIPSTCESFGWTDSMTVLHWLNSPPRRWKPFVANRVAQIQAETKIKRWYHVPGVDNPADDVSRGLLPDKLLSCHRWWHGPHWLSSKVDAWPIGEPETEKIESTGEERAIEMHVASVSTTNEFSNSLFSRFSTYLRLRRTTAYCLRFIACLRASKASTRPANNTQRSIHSLIATVPLLTSTELHRAELQLCLLAQQDSFPDDRVEIANGRDVPRGSRLKWLSPFIDQAGIMRVGGRLRNAQLKDSSKHPILLSSKHQLAVLLTQTYHHNYLHAGPELLRSMLRQRFWIIGGRNLTKLVFDRCHHCKLEPNDAMVDRCL